MFRSGQHLIVGVLATSFQSTEISYDECGSKSYQHRHLNLIIHVDE